MTGICGSHAECRYNLAKPSPCRKAAFVHNLVSRPLSDMWLCWRVHLMDIRPLLVEQRRTGDEFRVAERGVYQLQKSLSGRGVDAAARARMEDAMTSRWAELVRLGQRMLELDALVARAALRV